METPSFLVWALAQHCPLRQIAGWENPERTERLLRAAQAYDEARAQGRILDGIAVGSHAEHTRDPVETLAFRVDVALEIYGGAASVHAACDQCPANALRGHRGRQAVGCFGMWPLPQDLNAFCGQVDPLVGDSCEIAAELPGAKATSPRWYGLWLESPLAGPAAAAVASLVRQLALEDRTSAAGRDEIVLALDAAARGIPLHFLLYPPGRVEGPWWNLAPHCGRCKAPWSGGGQCLVCGQTSHPASPKKRHMRGTRPYYPLVKLLGEDKAADFLERYRQERGRHS